MTEASTPPSPPPRVPPALPDGLKPWEGSSAAIEQGKHWSSALIWLSAAIFGSAVLIAFTSRIDQTITVRGKLEPTGRSREVDAPATGVITRVRVKDGVTVRPGQPLIEIQSSALRSRKQAVQTSIEMLTAQNASLRGIVASRGRVDRLPPPPEIPAGIQPELAGKIASALQQTQQITARLLQLDARIASKQETLALNRRIEADLRPLYENGGYSRIQYLNQRNAIQEQIADIASLREEKESVIGTAAGQLNQNNRELETLRAELAELRETLVNHTITAPIAGKVFDLKASVAAVAVTDQVLLKIVPDNQLQASVEISNSDIGFVKVGMPATVAVDSFPAGEFGYLQGTLTAIGSDALPPDQQKPMARFPATITLQQQRAEAGGKPLNLQSGMGVSANIRLRSRPAINIVSDLFTKQLEGVKRFR